MTQEENKVTYKYDRDELARQLDALRQEQIKDARETASDLRNLLALLCLAWNNWESYDEETKATLHAQIERIDNEYLTLPWEEEGSWQANLNTLLENLNKDKPL